MNEKVLMGGSHVIGDMTVLIIGVGPIKEALKIMEDNWIQVLGSELYNI